MINKIRYKIRSGEHWFNFKSEFFPEFKNAKPFLTSDAAKEKILVKLHHIERCLKDSLTDKEREYYISLKKFYQNSEVVTIEEREIESERIVG